MFGNLHLYLSPFFLPRFYLRRDISLIIKSYKIRGSILDVGCGTKPYKNLFLNTSTYIGIEFENYSKNNDFLTEKPELIFPDSYSRTLRLPFKSNSYSNAVAFQVMEHHRNPRKMVSEMIRVIKPGGYILISVPFIGGIHERPNDFQRFTVYGIEQLCKQLPCKIVAIKAEGGFFSVISTLMNEELNTLACVNKFFYFLSGLLLPIFLSASYFALLLDKLFKSQNIVLNYIFLIKKDK